MSRTRWGSESPTDATAARGLLLNAAEECFERHGVTKTTVEDIATAARVTRATVYRYFGGRDEIVLAVALRDLRHLAHDLDAKAVRKSQTAADRLVDVVYGMARGARERPKAGLLFAPDAAGLTSGLVGGREALEEALSEGMGPFIEQAVSAGEFRPDLEVAEAVEWVIRVVTSFVTSPSRRRPSDERRYLHAFLAPAVLAPDHTS